MLTGATPTDDGRAPSNSLGAVKGVGDPHVVAVPRPPVRVLRQRTLTAREEVVFASGDLAEDMTHNFFLETAARNNKLKVHEMVEPGSPRAHRLPARCAAAGTRWPMPTPSGG